MKALIGQCRVADDATAKTTEEGYSYVFSLFLSVCIYAMLRQQAMESDLDVHVKIVLGPEIAQKYGNYRDEFHLRRTDDL